MKIQPQWEENQTEDMKDVNYVENMKQRRQKLGGKTVASLVV